jgi:hypothetical protein
MKIDNQNFQINKTITKPIKGAETAQQKAWLLTQL